MYRINNVAYFASDCLPLVSTELGNAFVGVTFLSVSFVGSEGTLGCLISFGEEDSTS